MQAELVHLEDRLDYHTLSDIKSEVVRRKEYSGNWYKLSRSKEDGFDLQWHTMLQVREKLKEYSRGFS